MRRVAFAVALASYILAQSPAAAFANYCSRPSEPRVPDGSYADQDEMERAQREIKSYIDEMQSYLQCLQQEASDASSEAESVQNKWNRSVSDYNSR